MTKRTSNEWPYNAHDDYEELEKLLPEVRKMQALAEKHGIRDIFLDNGGKVLQLLLLLGLIQLKGRTGNDAEDPAGKQYELKTLNINNSSKAFTSNHHLTSDILKKYEDAEWIFAVYDGIEISSVYRANKRELQYFFDLWHRMYEHMNQAINNPKIPLWYIIDNCELIYGSKPTYRFTKKELPTFENWKAESEKKTAKKVAKKLSNQLLAETVDLTDEAATVEHLTQEMTQGEPT